MNKHNRLLLWVLTVALLLSSVLPTALAADDKAALRKRLEDTAGSKCIRFFYDDYDRDGAFEAFGLIGSYDGSYLYSGDIWFVSSSMCSKLQANTVKSNPGWEFLGRFDRGSTIVFEAEENYYGSGSRSHLWEVKNGRAVSMPSNSLGKINFSKSLDYDAYVSGNGSDDDLSQEETNEVTSAGAFGAATLREESATDEWGSKQVAFVMDVRDDGGNLIDTIRLGAVDKNMFDEGWVRVSVRAARRTPDEIYAEFIVAVDGVGIDYLLFRRTGSGFERAMMLRDPGYSEGAGIADANGRKLYFRLPDGTCDTPYSNCLDALNAEFADYDYSFSEQSIFMGRPPQPVTLALADLTQDEMLLECNVNNDMLSQNGAVRGEAGFEDAYMYGLYGYMDEDVDEDMDGYLDGDTDGDVDGELHLPDGFDFDTTDTSSSRLTEEPDNAYGRIRITGGKVYLRNSPSPGGKIADIVHEGDEFAYTGNTVTDYRGVNWYQIRYGGASVWVSSKYSRKLTTRAVPDGTGSEEEEETYTPLMEESAGEYGRVRITGGKVYVRTDPSRGGKIVDIVHKGDEYKYLGNTVTDYRGVDWYQIRYGGASVWVSSKYSRRVA